MEKSTDSLTGSSNERTSKETEVSVNRDCIIRIPSQKIPKKDTTVILFGWGNASFKNVKKYSALYESLGYNTVLMRSYVMETALMPKLRSIPSIKSMLTRTKELLPKDKENPALIHVFSASGYMRYAFFTHMLSDASSPFFNMFDVKGLIIDSGPISFENGIGSALGAFYAAFKNPIIRFFGSIIIRIVTPLVIMFSSGLDMLKRETLHSSWKCPQLYLYSKADELSDASYIDYVFNFNKESGKDVKRICWDDSPHCAHFVKYPNEYREAVNTFLMDNCIN